jgi:molybdopterin synthase catalytic subunit
MDFSEMVAAIRNRPDAGRIGMILTHIGVVRQSSRDGRPVSGLAVAVDHERLEQILEKEKASPGIVDIRVEIVEGVPLSVGDEIMRLVVAGDIRDNVIPALERTLASVKETVTTKTENYEDK